MNHMSLLIPLGIFMGAVGLAAFLWSLRSGQYEDMAGDAARILLDANDEPLSEPKRHSAEDMSR